LPNPNLEDRILAAPLSERKGQNSPILDVPPERCGALNPSAALQDLVVLRPATSRPLHRAPSDTMRRALGDFADVREQLFGVLLPGIGLHVLRFAVEARFPVAMILSEVGKQGTAGDAVRRQELQPLAHLPDRAVLRAKPVGTDEERLRLRTIGIAFPLLYQDEHVDRETSLGINGTNL